MNSFKLGWRNYLYTDPNDNLTLQSGSVSVGSLADLRDMRLSKRCTMSADSIEGGIATVTLYWERAGGVTDLVNVGVLGLLNYSVSAPGAVITWRITLFTSAGTLVYDSIPVFDRPSDDFPQHLWYPLDSNVEVYGARILIDAEWLEGGGTLTVTGGAMWAGPVWSPDEGLDATWTQEVVDPGTVGRSVGGQGYPRARQRYRRWRGKVTHVGIKEAYGDPTTASYLDIQQLLYRIGKTQPIALFPRTKDTAGEVSTHLIHRLGIYGHLAETGRIDHIGGDFYQWTDAQVDELL